MPASEIALIVGLGNPGERYAHTRHNAGVDCLDLLCAKYRLTLSEERRFHGLVGRGAVAGHDLRLLFPTTFMNDSGQAVGALCSYFKIPPRGILVIHDDLDLVPGQLKFKLGGGLAGHNGLKSISAALGGSLDFYRMRLGIGKPQNRDTLSWVLGRMAPDDQASLNAATDAAIAGIEIFLKEGAQKATAACNGFHYSP